MAWVRNRAIAWHHNVPFASLTALKGDRQFRDEMRQTDLLLCADGVAEGILRAAPELARGVPVFGRGCVVPTGVEWSNLRRWLAVIDAVAEPDGSNEPDGLPRPPDVLLPVVARHLELAGMRCAEVWPVDPAASSLKSLRRIQRELGFPDRLEATVAYVDMWQGGATETDAGYEAIVVRACRRADEAWALGDRTLALWRLHSAIVVTLHRARHAGTERSPLVEAPVSLLQPVRRTATYQHLVGTAAERRAALVRRRRPKRRIGPSAPRVLLLPGAYGTFHQDLLDVLAGRARVEVAKSLKEPVLRRRRLRGADVVLLDALTRGDVDVLGGRWDDCPPGLDVTQQLEALRGLGKAITKCDVVIGEWLDPATMWASHLVPTGTKMVVRAHALDVLDSWLHLVNWGSVDRLLASNSAFAELLSEMTGDRGAPTPQVVMPYRPDLAHPPPQREVDARFIMAMVGWGRDVKDPHFALDLLERDPRRRLLLIGPGFPQSGPGLTQSYAESFNERLRNPDLADRVTVVGRTRDVAHHLAKTGVILSTSLREGWHLGLIEGAASGAVPVVRDWPMLSGRAGARRLFPDGWVVSDLDEADARIAALADPELWIQESRRARDEALHRFAARPAGIAYREAILTDPRAAC